MSNNTPLLESKLRLLSKQSAERSEILIEDATSISELSDASLIFSSLWGGTNQERYASTDLLKALVHSGGHVGVAYSATYREAVAASLAFPGKDKETAFLHSDLLGVLDGHRGCGIGYAMKLHQAAWSVENNYSEIRWTYDPLITRNAYFNFCKLGVEWVKFLPEFYSEGAEGDRFLVKWQPSNVISNLVAEPTRFLFREAESASTEVVYLPISALTTPEMHNKLEQLVLLGFHLAGVNEALEYAWVKRI